MSTQTECDVCRELREQRRIASPHDLTRTVMAIGEALDAGRVVQDPYWPKGLAFPPPGPFKDLSAVGPWDDFFTYYFRCTQCGRMFELQCETYHGRGGSWSTFEKPVANGG